MLKKKKCNTYLIIIIMLPNHFDMTNCLIKWENNNYELPTGYYYNSEFI